MGHPNISISRIIRYAEMLKINKREEIKIFYDKVVVFIVWIFRALKYILPKGQDSLSTFHTSNRN